MKKTSVLTLILLLPILAVLTGLTALPEGCLAQEALSVKMSLDKGPVIQAGDSVTVTLTPSGGRPPYEFLYAIFIDEEDEIHYSEYGYVPDNSHTWKVGFGGKVSFAGEVRDADSDSSASHSGEFDIQGGVYNPIKVTGRSISPGNVINVGEPITYSVFVEGGQPPYTYRYILMLYREGCWLAVDSGGHSSNSFTYMVAGGTIGNFYADIEDDLGRKVSSGPAEFKILGDNSEPMELSAASHSLVKLSKDRYQANLQVGVKGCALPVSYVCWWYLYKDGEMTGRIRANNTDGAFSLEEDFDVAIAMVSVTDADGWRSEKSLEVCFNTKDVLNPVLTELIKINLIRSPLMREELLNPAWRDLIGQIDIPILVSPPIPIPDAKIPELIKPKVAIPKEIVPEIVQPEILQPDITAPLLPALQLPSFPAP